jgi:tetratricopeptide (TPR) repeat protein
MRSVPEIQARESPFKRAFSRLTVALSLIAAFFVADPARADPSDATPTEVGAKAAEPPQAGSEKSQAPNDADAARRKSQAAAHFKRGRELFRDGAYASALAEFVRSKELYPTWSAASNAAVCLKNLERFDEALDMFESLLRDLGATLPGATRVRVEENIIALRKSTGFIGVDDAERGATLVVDGRRRGEYPAPGPLNVLAGSHVVRVYKEGFEPFEKSVEVAPGLAVRVSARLTPLIRSGRLRVKERKGTALDVVLDGFIVGKTPWEGPVAVGSHTVMLAGADSFGTLPSSVAIKLDQMTEIDLAAEDLGASVKVTPTPAGASVAVNGIFVGRGIFEGRLRPGDHTIKVVADGYFEQTKKISLKAGARQIAAVALRRDPDSPLWQRPPRFTFDFALGTPLSASLGGGLSRSCSRECTQDPAVGSYGSLLGGYELGSGFGFGVLAGYTSMKQATADRAATIETVGRLTLGTGTLDDLIEVRGFLAGAFASLRFGDESPLHLRLGAGALIGSLTDTRTGVFTTTASIASTYVVGPIIQSEPAAWLFLSPEIRAGKRLNENLEVSAGISALLLISPSPPKWNADHPINASTDGYGRLPEEDFMSSIVLALMPVVGARYDF